MWPQVGLLGAFGGGLLTAFILQDSKNFPIALFADNDMGLTWTVCWWLINYSPFDAVFLIHDFLPIKMVTKARFPPLVSDSIIGASQLSTQAFLVGSAWHIPTSLSRNECKNPVWLRATMVIVGHHDALSTP